MLNRFNVQFLRLGFFHSFLGLDLVSDIFVGDYCIPISTIIFILITLAPDRWVLVIFFDWVHWISLWKLITQNIRDLRTRLKILVSWVKFGRNVWLHVNSKVFVMLFIIDQSAIVIFLNIILDRHFNSFFALLLFSLAFDYLNMLISSDTREIGVLLIAEIVDILLIIICLN